MKQKYRPIAKVSRPIATGLFPRKRLFNVIDRSRKYPVIFIMSPPGSGKTSLIASYLENRKFPCLWYSIDRSDRDIASFFHYMNLAARNAAPGHRNPLPHYTPDYEKGLSVFARRWFENLFSRLSTPFFLVFDNYQDMPMNARFHRILSHCLEVIPNGLNVVIASRKGPPAEFSRLYTYDEVQVIGWDTIKLTLDEVKSLIEKKVPGQLQNSHIHTLYERTAGWIAGLAFVLKGIGHEGTHYELSDRLSTRSLFDFISGEIFHVLNKDTRRFLLMTSFFPAFTVKTAERLTGVKTAENILENLKKECCFIETMSHDTPVYRYHQLFKQFLRARAAATLSRNALSRVKHDAAVILEETGNTEEAVELLKESGDGERLISIIQKRAPSMVEQGRYQTLFAWLEGFPEKTLSDCPWLLYWKGVCRLPFDPAESQGYFEKAFERFTTAKREADGAFLSWAGVVEAVMYGSESLKLLDRWLLVVEKLLRDYKGFPSVDIESAVTCAVFRVLALRKPLHFDAGKWLPRIHASAQESRNIPRRIRALTSLAQYLYSCGEFGRLEIILALLNDLFKRHEVSPLTKLTVAWLQAAFLNAMSKYDACLDVISDAIELARNVKIKVMEYMLLGHGVLSSLKQGNSSLANRHLQNMASTLSMIKPWEAGFYHYCASWEALYKNNFTHALTHAERCQTLYEEIGNPWTLTIAHILQAHVVHASGNTIKAMLHISKACALGKQTENRFTEFLCMLNEAYFYLQQGKKENALKSIRNGLRIGKKSGFVNLFMWPSGLLERVLTEALDHGIEEEYCKQLIKRNDLIPGSHYAVSDRWPWLIRVCTLGRFGLSREGIPVQFTGKVQQKPLAMLKAIIAFGGREVSEDRLSDNLWPEADGEKAHNAFTTTLSRLRHLLGTENVIRFHEGKALLDPRYCWVDVWVFERMLGEAFSLWEKEGCNAGEAMNLSLRAISMYTGPFLAGEDEPWMISIRERLRNKFLRIIKRCGNYLEQAGRLHSALECYEMGLEVDDLLEEFYLREMHCYHKMGKRAEALSVYNRCHKILSSVLGIVPSEETEALARELKR